MEKLILILSILTFFTCINPKVEQNNLCQNMVEIGLNEINAYLKALDSVELDNTKIIEYKIEDSNQHYFFADMSISKPYLKGRSIPKYHQKINFNGKDIHLLIYCNRYYMSQKDSIDILTELKKEGLIVNDLIEWTTFGKWATHDFESFKFIFCRDDASSYTINTRIQEAEENLVYPKCK